MNIKYSYIAVEGAIGAGKTTLSRKLSEDFNGKLILEDFKDNSFLPKFYESPDKYAFPLEMSFLADRYQQLKTALSLRDIFTGFTISDYFFNKSLVFARKNLHTDMYRVFLNFFNILNASLPQPDLIIYLYANQAKLLANIKKRGRAYESGISPSYLEAIQTGYLKYFHNLKGHKILIVETDHLDFVSNSDDYAFFSELLHENFETGIHFIRQ
ncbi:MAG: deoxynucleoside kinase [Bacteroidales bacterium]|nr:deoxynucleoside kinase [Bacteroidales bacterium]